jgi:hypothetical protein
MSLVVSDIGAKDMIGLAGDGYRYGIVMMNFDFVGCILPVLLAAFLFMPFFWGSNVTTIPEYLGRRYNPSVRTFFAVVEISLHARTVATILVSAAAMFEALGWSFWVSVKSPPRGYLHRLGTARPGRSDRGLLLVVPSRATQLRPRHSRGGGVSTSWRRSRARRGSIELLPSSSHRPTLARSRSGSRDRSGPYGRNQATCNGA